MIKIGVASFMDSIADFYDDICHPCSEDRVLFLRNFITRNLGKGSIILDEACNTGETLLSLNLSDSYTLLGVDLSAGMINKCLAKNRSGSNKFFVDDMRFLNHLHREVDFIYNNSIVWLSGKEEMSQTFRRAYEVICPNGWMIVDTNNSETLLKEQQKLFSSCVATDDCEIYKTTLFHNLDKEYFATQIYTVYRFEEDIVDSYASRIKWAIYDMETICKMITEAGFTVKETTGDYGTKALDKASHIQFICQK